MDIRNRKLKGYVALSILIIVCMIMASAMTFFAPKNNAEAICDSSKINNIGNLLLSDYDSESRTDGKVFDGDVVNALFEKLTGIKNANYNQVLQSSKTPKKSTYYSEGDKELVVTIGGYTWSVVYFSNTSNDGSGDPIVTLWLTDSEQLPSSYNTVQWSTYYVNDGYVKYPTNMYGTSRIRAVSLNNGGKYATSTSTLSASAVTPSASHPFAKFTVPNSTTYNSSLTSFIAKPNEVEWQRKESSSTATGGVNNDPWNYNNDALEPIDSSSFRAYDYQTTPSTSIISQAQRTLDYTAWGSDNIWLPSLAEIGWNEPSLTGLWDINYNVGGNSAGYNTWTRSATLVNACDCVTYDANGATAYNEDTTTGEAVRPAFHLNLAKVAKAMALHLPLYKKTNDNKDDNLKYYDNGSDVTFELDKINKELVDIEFTAEYLDSEYKNVETAVTYSCTPSYANGGMSFKVNEVGKYTVKVTPKEGQSWVDGTNETRTYTYTLKYKVSEPKFSENSTTSIEKTYDKSEKSLALTYNKDLIDVKIKDADSTNLKFDIGTSAFKVKNAKTSYVVDVALKNNELMEWSTAGDISDKSLTITIKKMQIAQPKINGDKSKPYTGSAVTFPLLNYSATGGDVELKGPSPSTNVVTSIAQTNVGTYNYTVSLKDKDNTAWADEDGGGKDDFTLTVSITSSGINKPSLSNTELLLTQKKTYSTTTTPKGATFTLYNTTGVTIEPADEEQTDAVLSGNTITVTKAGTYIFNVELADKSNTEWKDGTKAGYTITVTVDRKSIDIPQFALGADKKTYNGSEQTFNLTMDNDAIEIRDSESNVVTAITGKNARTYEYTLNLKDPINTQWKGTSDGDVEAKSISVTVDKKALKFTISCSVSGSTPTWETGADNVVYTVVIGETCADDTIKLRLYTEKGGIKSNDFASIDESVANTVKAALPDYLLPGGYIFGIDLPEGVADNDNYKLPVAASDYRKSFTIKGQGLSLTADNMPWRCKYVDKDNLEIPVEIMGEGYVTGKAKLTYNTYEYEFYVDVDVLSALGAEIDTEQGANGFSGDIKWKNATTATKTFTVYWKPAEGYEGEGGSFTLTYEIEKAKYDLSKVYWNYVEGSKEYTGDMQRVDLVNPYSTLIPDIRENTGTEAKDYTAKIREFGNTDENYFTPEKDNPDTYIYTEGKEFPWNLPWSIGKAKLTLVWEGKVVTDKNGRTYTDYVVNSLNSDKIERYEYYIDDDDGLELVNDKSDIAVVPGKETYYKIKAILKDNFAANYEIVSGETRSMTVGANKNEIMITMPVKEFTYDGNAHGADGELSVVSGSMNISNVIKTYYKDSVSEDNKLSGAPIDSGEYILVMSLNDSDSLTKYLGAEQIPFKINKIKIKAVWNTSANIPVISNLDETTKAVVGYVYYDEEGNQLEEGATLEAGKNYKVKAILVGDNASNYEFVTEDNQPISGEVAEVENLEKSFTVSSGNSGNNVGVGDGNEPDPTEPQQTFDIAQFLKEYWQPIATLICIILIIIFMSKGIGYAGKRKKIKKTIEKKYSGAYYAVGGTGLFGLTYTNWTVIACIMLGVTVLAFVFMLLEKRTLNKAEEELEDAKDEYAKNQKEAENKQMQMMLMGMMGGNANGQGFAYNQGVSADEMRLMLNDAMTAMLPNVTQYLPQEASSNEDIMRKLEEQNEENEKRIQKLNEENEDRIKQLTESNEKAIEKLAEKLSKQQDFEKQAEREVASTNANDEIIKSLLEGQRAIMEKLSRQDEDKQVVKVVEKDSKDEKIEMLMRNQEMLMRQMMEMSGRNNDKQVVMPYMPQPTLVQQPAEKIIIEKPVEKIVEKEVRVEVPVEKIVEVEKVVPMPIEKPAPKAKTPAQRLTLDEAYAKLSATQKKIFDTLKAYAMSKDKCKEKKSTYFIVLGQSTVNPLVKLTIKKNTTVALFKMEDEYFKDIRRNAGSDGTKVKVKESEVVVNDAQALATAKNMVDLREDQIERYNEYLREQRAMKRK